jgi:hypothetical protein
MCNCIKEIEDKMVGRDHKGKKIKEAQLISAAIMFGDFKTRTVSEMELTLEGQKKIAKQNIIHSYCPFCGKEYPKLKDEKR